MGLPILPGPIDGGVLPFIVMNTVSSVAHVRNKLQSVFQSIGAAAEPPVKAELDVSRRRVSITRYGFPIGRRGGSPECCVCLSKFEAEEEISELTCGHFFHRSCLKKWFDNHHVSCPLCRSVS